MDKKRWLMIGAVAIVVVVPFSGIAALLAAAAKKIRDKRLDARVARQEQRLRMVAGC